MRRWTMWLALLCGGCLGQCGAVEDTGPACEQGAGDVTLRSFEKYGSAAWDGVGFGFSAPDCGYPMLYGDERVSIQLRGGEEVYLEPVEGCMQRWVAPEGLPAGEYGLLTVHDVDYGPEGIRDVLLDFEGDVVIGDYGRDPAFSTEGLAGKAFELDPDSIWECSGLGPVLQHLVEGLWIELLEVQGDQVRLRALQELEDGTACVYLEDTAELSATGELRWSQEHLDLATDPAIETWDLSLRLGLDAEALEAAGVEFRGTMDVVNLVVDWGLDSGEVGNWERTCQALASVNVPCGACPEGDTESCVSFDTFGGSARLRELPFDTTDLPDCTASLDTGRLSCDLGCSAASRRQLPLALLGLLGLVALRRRRSTGGEPRGGGS
jgi:MYXO-CTERM domain-containing protein